MSDGNIVKKGDVMRLATSGGGGWGHPFDRPLERVRRDVLGGVVSVEAARTDYGVVIDAAGTIDASATRALRATSRGSVRMFHRGDYFGPPAGQPSR
jgi:N-methylhydantoinase B